MEIRVPVFYKFKSKYIHLYFATFLNISRSELLFQHELRFVFGVSVLVYYKIFQYSNLNTHTRVCYKHIRLYVCLEIFYSRLTAHVPRKEMK